MSDPHVDPYDDPWRFRDGRCYVCSHAQEAHKLTIQWYCSQCPGPCRRRTAERPDQ